MLYAVAEYLLKHKEGLLWELRKRMFAEDHGYFEDIFEQQATIELCHEVALGLHENYEDVALFLTPDLVKAYCGIDFFRKISCGVSQHL